MGITFFVVATGLAVAGYLGYRKLQSLEEEIREELESSEAGEGAASETGSETATKLTPVEKTAPPPSVKEASEKELETIVLDKVGELPGILQTEIYDAFADRDRKELQGLLLKMDREGSVRRERKGSTYQIFPA